MKRLVLIRHGESLWNLENRFTGWTDVDLDDEGKYEALHAGHVLREAGFSFDIVFTSVLKRSIHTAWNLCDIMNLPWVPFVKAWQLNERHYGALQGLNKQEMIEKHGEDQVHVWRRSFGIQPPALDVTDKRNPKNDKRYQHLLSYELPLTESLKDTIDRVLPYWEQKIFPLIDQGKEVLVAAHGNSLRALVKHLLHISDGDITSLNIPTGVPQVFEFSDDMQVLNHYYLGTDEHVEKQTDRASRGT